MTAREGCLSTQVLQEFYVTATRKLAQTLTALQARGVIELYRAWPCHRVEVDDTGLASQLTEQYSISFWDALIVRSAERLGAEHIVSEDLQHDPTVRGVQIHNPFAEKR